MISERKLRVWRREALVTRELARDDEVFILTAPMVIIWANRMLEMSQELLDQALLKKGGKDD